MDKLSSLPFLFLPVEQELKPFPAQNLINRNYILLPNRNALRSIFKLLVDGLHLSSLGPLSSPCLPGQNRGQKSDQAKRNLFIVALAMATQFIVISGSRNEIFTWKFHELKWNACGVSCRSSVVHSAWFGSVRPGPWLLLMTVHWSKGTS